MIIKGTRWDDELNGTAEADQIYGRGGDDDLFGDAGDDALYGGQGDDTINGGWGSDRIFGGNGFDTLYGGDGVDELHGAAGGDILYAGLSGGILFGDRGEDVMAIHAGRAEGGTGNDRFLTGDNTIGGYAAGHVDILTGKGSDTVQFQGVLNDAWTSASVLDFGQFGQDGLVLLAYYGDGAFLADGKTLAGWLDKQPDGVLDAKDQAAGAAIVVDEAANTIALGIMTDTITLHGLTALPVDFIS